MKQQDHGSQSLDQITGMLPVGGLMKQRLNPHSSRLNLKKKIWRGGGGKEWLGYQTENQRNGTLKYCFITQYLIWDINKQAYKGMIQFCVERF